MLEKIWVGNDTFVIEITVIVVLPPFLNLDDLAILAYYVIDDIRLNGLPE